MWERRRLKQKRDRGDYHRPLSALPELVNEKLGYHESKMSTCERNQMETVLGVLFIDPTKLGHSVELRDRLAGHDEEVSHRFGPRSARNQQRRSES